MSVIEHKTVPSPRRLYREVAEQIRTQIENGSFGPGTRLPSER
ncbi:MAG: GntR family transcriptional regulator, partial [Comamonadaceae bacterium]|nr:GntR family transcriptional regulator [Comamonadaceae bacterium]